MADLLDLSDVSQYWGNDLQVSPTGDLVRSITVERSKQHVLRRLLTAIGNYIAHTNYGAGLPGDIGTVLDLAKIKAKIVGQMALEASVAQSPPPTVTLVLIANGISANIIYTVAPERVPAVLSFSLDA